MWSGLTSATLPFIAAFIDVIPPWPRGVQYITAIFQLVAIVVAYKFSVGIDRARVERNMLYFLAIICVLFVCYLFGFSLFSIHVPKGGFYIVGGYQCTERAFVVYKTDCPFLNLDALKAVSYDETELWTKLSLSITRTALAIIWFLFFGVMSVLLGQFITY